MSSGCLIVSDQRMTMCRKLAAILGVMVLVSTARAAAELVYTFTDIQHVHWQPERIRADVWFVLDLLFLAAVCAILRPYDDASQNSLALEDDDSYDMAPGKVEDEASSGACPACIMCPALPLPLAHTLSLVSSLQDGCCNILSGNQTDNHHCIFVHRVCYGQNYDHGGGHEECEGTGIATLQMDA